MEPLLQVDRLSIAFGSNPPVVQGASLTLRRGEALGIVGASGSGKSLTALALVGLLPAGAQVQGGQLTFSPTPERTYDLRLPADLRSVRGSGIGMIFQEPLTALNPVHRCGAQLLEAVVHLRPEISRKADRAELVREWLGRVELGDRADHILRAYPHQLSGGQRQRVLIALALIGEPDLLLADEPTTALDTVTQREILLLLDRLRQDLGMALLFITHDRDVLRQVTDRHLTMERGRLTEESVKLAPAHRRPVTPTPGGSSANPSIPSSFTPFAVQELTISYGPTTVVRDFDLTVNPREWLALVGSSGCGKTTVARCLAGLVPARTGKLTTDTVHDLRVARPRPGVQLIFQDPATSLNPRHSVRTILREALRAAKSRISADALLIDVDLSPNEYLDRLPHQLSGGQRQRLAIARALAAEPQLLICDESVSALDAELREGILELLDRLRTERDISILFISHDLSVVAERADRILVMDAGRIVESAAPKALLSAPRSAAAKALVAAALPKI